LFFIKCWANQGLTVFLPKKSEIELKILGAGSKFHTGSQMLGVTVQNLFAMRWTVSPTHGATRVTADTCYSIAATTPELTIEILNSVF